MQDDIQARERFFITLEWLLALQERYPNQLQFGLIHVCFNSREVLGAAYGANTASQMLVDLARQLRQAFRKTDLVARDLSDFWILVPYTSPDTVTDKIAQLVEIASENGLSIVDRDIAVFSLPDSDILQSRFASVPEFLEHLKKNRQATVRWDPARQPA